jgi:putative acetyltransferase
MSLQMDYEVRRVTPADAEGMARLMSDEAVFGGLLQLPFPSADAWRKRLDKLVDDSDSLSLVAVAGGHILASAGIFVRPASPRRRHAGTLGISVAVEWQRKGIGTRLMRELLHWADRWTNLQRIELTVYTENEPAIALYRKFGFETEGTLRAFAIRDGAYVDAYGMARLHPKPPQLPHPLPDSSPGPRSAS